MESNPRFEFIAAFPGTLRVNSIVLIGVLMRVLVSDVGTI